MGNCGKIATSLLALSLSGAALAQDDEDRATYITILGTYSQLDDARNDLISANNPGSLANIDEGAGVHFIIGQQRASGFGFEASLFAESMETDVDGGTDFYRQGLGLDLIYGFGDRSGFTPFFLVGGGAAYNDMFPDYLDDYSWFANAGLGLITGPLNKYGIKMRLEVRYLYDDFEDGYSDYRAGLGLEIPLFGEPKVVEKIVEKVKVVEIAGDGLADSDNDGIVDNRDNCPGTPEGTRVDGNGCPLGDVVGLEGVTFETNKDRLRPDAVTILDDVSRVLERYPEMLVEVAGHTDNIGSDEYNQNLSQMRAEAVRQYLINKGISGDRMTAVGYGESEPRDTNDTFEGRERNRRVELRIKN